MQILLKEKMTYDVSISCSRKDVREMFVFEQDNIPTQTFRCVEKKMYLCDQY